MNPRHALFGGLAAALACGTWWLADGPASANAEAQQKRNQQRSESARATQTLSIPPSQEVLQVEVDHPDEVRVGESYQYQIRVKNVSEQIAVRDVRIAQTLPEKFEIEKDGTSQQGQAGQKKDKSGSPEKANQQDRKPQQNDSQNQKQQQKNQQNEQNKSQQRNQEANAKDRQIKSEKQDGKQIWTISELMPGDSKTIQVTAASDQEGPIDTCLTVASYTPSLCLQAKSVKPDLKLVKRAPEKAAMCEEIEFEYFVENEGSADLKPFNVRDELPEGLETIAGDKHLDFKVDGLKAGDTRKFVASLRATKADEFSSRAIVKLDGGETVRSQKTTTKVQEADLAVAIDGPDTQYVERPTTYTIRVSNNGDVPAPNTQLTFNYPQAMSVANVGELSDSDQLVQSDSSQSGDVQSRAFRPDSDSKQQQDGQQKRGQTKNGNNSQQSSRQESWDIGTLKPGETRQVRVTVRPQDGGQFSPRATAKFVCGKGTDNEITQTVQASLQTEVLALAALLIGVVDSDDPVEVGNETTYTIIVENEGSAADQNIDVSVQLPEQLKFVKASGETKAKAEGNTVNFEQVKELQPGESVRWKLQTKATGEGETALKVRLQSDSFNSGVTAEEPTRLYKTSNSQNKDGKNSQKN